MSLLVPSHLIEPVHKLPYSAALNVANLFRPLFPELIGSLKLGKVWVFVH